MLLQVEGLKTQFQMMDGIVHAVNGVSFNLEEYETLGIVGESGCGKSVSVMSIMRLIPMPPGEITSGKVIFEDRDLLELTEHEMCAIRGNQISMIFQDPMTCLNPVITVGKQISEAIEFHLEFSPADARQRAIELLELVEIPLAKERYDQYPHEYSGGMRQRAMIAMGLSCQPKVLIADEPTTALDVTIQAQIIEIVKKLQDEIGMSVIWITHDLGVVAGVADKTAVMYAGYIVEKAKVNELYAEPKHPYTIGLLESLPAIGSKGSLLPSIEGIPPDMKNLPKGCPFYDRCKGRMDICSVENPTLVSCGENHDVACWLVADKKLIYE